VINGVVHEEYKQLVFSQPRSRKNVPWTEQVSKNLMIRHVVGHTLDDHIIMERLRLSVVVLQWRMWIDWG